jgi:hypothetical protein
MLGDELVERIDRSLGSELLKRPPQPPRPAQLREEGHAAARIAWHECSVTQDEPPAILPLVLGHIREQRHSLGVCERQKRQLV